MYFSHTINLYKVGALLIATWAFNWRIRSSTSLEGSFVISFLRAAINASSNSLISERAAACCVLTSCSCLRVVNDIDTNI